MELNFSHASIRQIQAALAEFGVVLLRHSIQPDVVTRYRDALASFFRDDRDNRLGDISAEERTALDRGDVLPATFLRYSGLDLAEYFVPLHELAQRVLVKPNLYNQTFLTVQADSTNPGLNPHTDGIIQGTTDAVLAFWSPMRSCGVDAPGLSIFPASREKVLAYLRRSFPDKQIPGWYSTTEWERPFHPDNVCREFGPPWCPEIHSGDVMIFTNWTIHGSHVRPTMANPRSAIVQRWRSDDWRKPTWFERLTGR